MTLRLPHGMPRVGSVLIVDDDPGFRQVLRGLLDGIAERVIEAADGEQALAAVEGRHTELALIDLRMPGIDGYTLLQRLPATLPATSTRYWPAAASCWRPSATYRATHCTPRR
jgi:CheY-like chemotaxis protein